MISLYLLPDRTRLVKAESTSNGKLKIIAIDELSSYWEPLVSTSSIVDSETGISNAAMALVGMFREARRAVRISGEEFFIVLPDSLFTFLDCVREPQVEEGIEPYVSAMVEKPADTLAITVPFRTRPGAELYQTIFALSKDLIQRIVDAAGEEGITLSSIEPASIAFLRASGAYDREIFFLEAFKDSASIIAYSPVGGMFRMDAPLLAESRLLDMPEISGDLDVREVFAEIDMTADRSFPSANDDVNMVIIAGQRRKFAKFKNMEARLTELTFADNIFSDHPAFESSQDWMAAVGTLLQEAPEESPLYFKKPTYLSVVSGNLLPKGMQTNAKLFRVTQRVKRISRITLLAGMVILAALLLPSFYFLSIEIPNTLQARYDETQKALPTMEAELAIIGRAKKEHCYPLVGFQSLLAARPATLGFSSVKIGESVGQKDVWLEADLVSKDPLTFQDYITAVSMDKTFKSAAIIKIGTIGTDSSGFKTATIRLRKGDGVDEE